MDTRCGSEGAVDAGGDAGSGWPFCAGAMADGIRGHSWERTPLGALAHWPPALRFAAGAMLEARFPSLVVWGPELTGLYNDACIPFFGDRLHPLGRRFDETWADIWPEVGLVYESAMAGQPSFFADLPLRVQRPGLPDLSWWTFSCSPIRDERGEIGGVQATFLETTSRIRSERRQAFLIGLGDALRRLSDGGEIAAATCACLGRHLGADRVGYAEIDLEDGAAKVGCGWTADESLDRPGSYDLEGFGAAFVRRLASGATAAVRDVERDPLTEGGVIYASFGIRAILVVPLIRSGRWVNALSVAKASPHDWTDDETALVADVAERTWEAVERARAENSLRESRDRLDAALEAARMVAWNWDPSADRVTFAGSVAEVFGLAAGDSIDSSSRGFERVHPDDVERHRAAVVEAAERREGYESEFRVIRPVDGRTSWLEERARPHVDPVTGQPGLTGLVWDVTRRKQAEIATDEARREVAEELAVVTKLHDWAVRVARPSEWPALLDEMLKAAMDVLDADFGTIRVYDPANDTLSVVAHAGCNKTYLKRFRTVPLSDEGSIWGRSLRSGQRIVVGDLRNERRHKGLRAAAREFRFQALQVAPLFDRAGLPVGALTTGFQKPRRPTKRETRLVDLYGAQIADVIGARQARTALATSERRLRRLIEGIPQLVWRATTAGRAVWHSPQWCAYTGLSPDEGLDRGWLRTIHPDDRPVIAAAWAEAEAAGAYECECRILSAREGRYRWFQERAVAEPTGEDGALEWLGTSTDIDALRTLHEHQRALLSELQQRVRHTLARLRTIVRRTVAAGGTLDDYVLRLDGRLDALSRAQAPVMRDPHAGVDLYELVANELTLHQAHGGRRVTIDGPPVRLRPGAADVMALALHELAANAVEHGALSQARGRIAVAWRIEDGPHEPRLHLAWTEAGLPVRADGEPAREGFGFAFLNRTLPEELGGGTDIAFSARGFCCTITLPLTPRIARHEGLLPREVSDAGSSPDPSTDRAGATV